MNKLKRFLALFLVLSMMLGAVPFGAFASESTEPTGETAAPVADATEGEHESTEAPEETQVVEDTTASEETQATDPNAGIMTTATTTKPADGTTTSQPFTSGTGGSEMFRIPAIVTLSNGTLVAAADARWDDKNDRGNIDTIVSYSTDNGATWNYTFANYIADSGNSYNLSAATFIDPALAVKTVDGKETIYMLVDLFPGQTSSSNCIAVANSGTGFDDDGYLKLSTSGSSSSSTYGYYLKDGKIYDTSTNTDQGYTVDAYFNVSKDGTELGNLFTRGTTGFYVLQTSYLYLTKSTDGGATWSEPQMLNSQVKGASETFYGVGPGAGLVTSTGRIIFPCYTYSNEYTSVIYSDDNGATWNRSASMTSSSSEATLVEVDGRIYMFTRYGGYYYSDDDGATWSSKQNVSGISYTTSCQLSALVYSKLIDGQTAILLSAPTSNRTTGKIFVGLVNEDKSITWKYTYAVNGSGTYQYSSMAELADGSIGLLYENGDASITYTNIAISDIASGAEITVPETPDEGEDNTGSTGETTLTDGATDVTITVDESILTKIAIEKLENSTPAEGYTASVTYSIVINDGEYTDGATVKIPYDETVFGSCNTFIGSVDGTTFPVSAPVDGYFTVDVPHFSDVTISGQASELTQVDVALAVGESTTITDATGNYESSYTGEGLDAGVANVEVTGQDASTGTTYTEAGKTYGELATVKDTATATNYYYKAGDVYYQIYAYYTQQRVLWWTTTTYYYGYYVNGTWYQIGSSETSGDTVTVYEAGTAAVSASTTIAIDAISPGSTSVVVGSTQYNITVNPIQANLSVQTGKTVTTPITGMVTSADVAAFNNTYGAIATVAIDGSNLVFTGVAEGTVSSCLLGNTNYTISVVDIPDCVDLEATPFVSGTGNYSGSDITKLTISVGKSYDLNLDISGTDISWTSLDESIATVDQNGTITGVAVGKTYVTCTVDGVTYAIPVVVLDTVDETKTSTATGVADLYIAEITNTDVAYSIDLSTDLLEAQEGEIIYLDYAYGADKEYGFAINFFGAEDEGYALTYMASTNSDGNYYALYATDDVTGLSAYSSGAMLTARNYWEAADTQELLEYAINSGYDGTMGWTRGSSNPGTSINSSLTFRSQKLPTVTKEIVSVGGQDYVEGMTAKAGDVINFRITVTQYATTEAITYTNDTLTETLVPISGSSYSVSSFLADTTLSTDKTYTYDVSYTIKDSDLDTMITNTVSLAYTYDAPYSDGNFSESANASAKITATTYTAADYVIDFGLPTTFQIAGWGTTDISGISAEYGDVTISGNHTSGYAISYQPNQILQNVDTVTMTNDVGAEYTFKVYPATTVYYEEGFITWDSDWSGAGMGSGTQEAQVLGSSTDNYGYDDAYADDTGSNGTQATTSTIGATGEFTFTGTGIDVYANCTTETGYVYVQIKDAAGATEGLYIVDTVAATGTSDATAGQSAELDSLPIVSVQNLTHGTHTVIIRKVMETEPVHIDGIRIYNTVEDSTVFAGDLEDNPAFYQLRDYVLQAIGVTSSTSEDYKTMVEQVYAGIGTDTEKPSAVVLANGSYNDNVQDLLDNGPKNELFLHTDENLVFRVQTNRVMQIGLKAPNGDAAYEIKVDTNTANSGTISSSTDMFYDVVGNIDSDTTREVTITITNTGSNILSVTDLKICDDPSAAFVPLTAEDIEVALMAMGYGGSEEEPSEPETEPSEPETEPSEPETEPSIPETEEPTEPETEPVKPEKPDNSIHNAIHKVIRDVVSIIKNLFSFWR